VVKTSIQTKSPIREAFTELSALITYQVNPVLS